MGMPAAAHRWTRQNVLALMERNPLQSPRYETVDGELFVTPSPGGPHQFAVGRLLRCLGEYLDGEPIGEAVASPSDVELEPGVLVQPDVYVVPPAEAMRLRNENAVHGLLLAVEVLSPGSARGDRGKKRALYQRRVPEYWIVDVESRQVERWRPGDTRGEIITDRVEWHPAGARAPFVLDLAPFFARVWGEPELGARPA